MNITDFNVLKEHIYLLSMEASIHYETFQQVDYYDIGGIIEQSVKRNKKNIYTDITKWKKTSNCVDTKSHKHKRNLVKTLGGRGGNIDYVY